MSARLLLFVALLTAGCAVQIPPCSKGKIRIFCSIEVLAAAPAPPGGPPPSCITSRTRGTIAGCVDRGPDAFMDAFNALQAWIAQIYPQDMLEFSRLGGVYARPWGGPPGGPPESPCNYDTNPFPGPIFAVHTADEGGGGSSAAGDCDACLAMACPGAAGADLDTCVHDHCAALCPLSSDGTCAGPMPPVESCADTGSTCGGADVCCSGLACYATDSGSVCQ